MSLETNRDIISSLNTTFENNVNKFENNANICAGTLKSQACIASIKMFSYKMHELDMKSRIEHRLQKFVDKKWPNAALNEFNAPNKQTIAYNVEDFDRLLDHHNKLDKYNYDHCNRWVGCLLYDNRIVEVALFWDDLNKCV